MERIDNSKIKPMLVDIMDEIHAYAESNGIRYYLIAGTLIGAIRHNGFIPWDDDIDIVMPRPDYDRFLKEYSHPYLKIISSSNDETYPLDYAKVHDTRTLTTEEGGDGHWGVSIDIFPLDGLPTMKLACEQFEKTRKLRRLVANQRFTRKGKLKMSNGLVKNASIIIGRLIHPFVSFNKIMLKMDSLMKKYDYDSSEFCGCLCWRKLIFRRDMFGESTHEFEGRTYHIPSGYDEVLRIVFGDYMQLPPEDKRVSLHGTTAYWL